MKDDDLHFLLGSLKSDLEHIKRTTDSTNEKLELIDNRVGTLETWRNGLVIAWMTAVGIFSAMGVTVQKAIASITNHAG
ncbi:MAG: hypothetical protein ABFD79_14765 [Phycisphaerales bacterium]